MPRDNVELAKEGYATLNRGDVDRFVNDITHPDYEFHTGVQIPSVPEVVRGREELRAWIEHWYKEPWQEQLQMDVERLEQLEDGRVLALLVLRAKGRDSGIPVENEYGHILTFRDGLYVRVDGFPTWKRALAAAGLAD